MRADFYHALFWLGVGIFTTFLSTHYSLGSFADPGPGSMPFGLGLAFILLSLIYLAQSVRRRPVAAAAIVIGPRWRRVAGVAAVLLASAVVFEDLGYLATIFLLVAASMLLIEPGRWKLALFTAFASSLGSYVIFDIWLKVQLPRGILSL